MTAWERRAKECKTVQELDELATYYLRCNDPYYTDRRPDKMDKLEYPYHTPTMTKEVSRKEIAESNVNIKGTFELKRKGMAENKEI